MIYKIDVFSLFSWPETPMPMEFFFLISRMSLIFTGKFMCLKSSFLAKSVLAFVILAGRWFAEFKYLTVLNLKQQYFEF